MSISPSIDKEIRAIVSSLRAEDAKYIRELTEAQLFTLHRSLGLTLRNEFRSGRYPFLFGYCFNQHDPETRSFDSISIMAIKLIWDQLREQEAS
jgi:hypothetical protein